jgi:uncharacterized protein YjbI with pentapeptide repeats
MANEEQLAILRQGAAAWNAWREGNRDIWPDLSDADLRGANLREADLTGADLTGADLRAAELRQTDLHGAKLQKAEFSDVDLSYANLDGASLDGANLGGSFNGALGGVLLDRTILANLDLSSCKGLGSCRHGGPSIVTTEPCSAPGGYRSPSCAASACRTA